MLLAQRGLPSLRVFAVTLIGGSSVQLVSPDVGY
jgi:hypothetical protein